MKPAKLTKDKIQQVVSSAIEDAISFIEGEIAPDRIRAQKYFDGRVNLETEDGRSKVVATKCRDTIRAVKPSLMRVFLQSGKPVEFVPRSQQTADAAGQATNYASSVFDRNKGFDFLSDVFHDALIKKVGIGKVWYDEVPHVEIDEYTGINDDFLALLDSDDETEFLEVTVEQEAEQVPSPDGMSVSMTPAIYNARVAHTSTRGEIKIKSVPPEDFFVDRGATCLDDAYVVGHTSEMRVGDLVAMGFDFSTVFDLAGAGDGGSRDEEEQTRTQSGYSDDSDEASSIDPSMREIRVTEAYMRMDIEGTGIPRLYKFICAGQGYEVLEQELCDFVPFAVFEVDPEPHTFFGRSLVDIITHDQDASTSLLRGMIDGIHLANNPRLVVNASMVQMDDVLNNEIGGIIRAKDVNAIREIVMGMGSGATMPVIQYYDELIRSKTGVSGAGMGMDPDALQSQTAAGVNAAVQAASAVSELIARTLAEGGMTQLFRLVAQIARANPNPEEMMRIDGRFVPVDPRSWTADMDVMVNVGLGTNQHAERLMTLNQTLQMQMQIWQSYGPSNGIVSLTGIRNTMADVMALGGIHNANRYINPMDAQTEQAMMQQQAQQAEQAAQGQQGGDPNAAYLQAEQMKVSARTQADMMKAQTDMQKAAMNDDRERDKMQQDLALGAAEILGKYGATVDVARIRQEQAMTQPMGQQPMNQPGMNNVR